MDEESKKRLGGTVSSISKLDILEAAGHAAVERVEREWLDHCQATGTSPDNANAKGIWLAIGSERDFFMVMPAVKS